MNINTPLPLISNRYQIVNLLGEGSMGKVFLATDIHTGKPAAVKFLKTDAITETDDMLERFKREAEALRQLDHPNIVKMIETGEEHEQHYIIMEYVGGGSLADLLKQQRLPVERVVKIAIELADALARTHHLKIIHRDLKPSNVLLAEDGTLRLTDFGIAQLNTNQRITQSGVALGTLYYLSPEAINGEEVDSRTDIWSFGVMLFEMLSGKHPFAGTMPASILKAVLTEEPLDLTSLCPNAPIALIDLIYQMLEKDRGFRVRSARQIGAALEALGQDADSSAITPLNRIRHSAREKTAATIQVRKSNLPRQLTSFIGREQDIAQIKQRLQTTCLLTLTGPGGTGKTRLSLQAADTMLDAYPHGVWVVELATVTDSSLVPSTVASMLDVPGKSNEPMLTTLSNYLSDKHLLLILDNCEHLIESCAALTETLLQAAPNIHILATSREALNVPGERVYQVSTLSYPSEQHVTAADLTQYEATRLFIERAEAVQSNFKVTDDTAPAIVKICRQLDGIPLALELVAPRIRMMNVEQIADKLSDSFRLLKGGSRGALPRQQTLKALIDWSYDLLSEKEQILFRRLSVFAGGWTLDAAEVVCADEALLTEDVFDTLTKLINKSLAVALPESEYEPRFRLLETMRQYGFNLVEEGDELRALQERYANYYLELAEKAAADEENIFGSFQHWLPRLRRDYDNFRTVRAYFWERAKVESVLRLATALGTSTIADAFERKKWLEQGLVLYLERSLIRARALLALARIIRSHMIWSQSVQLIEESLVIFRELGNKQSIASALIDLSRITPSTQHRRLILEESLRLYSEIGHQAGIHDCSIHLGLLLFDEGNYVEARARIEDALRIIRQYSESSGWEITGWTISDLASIAIAEGKYAEAQSLTEEALSLHRKSTSQYGIAFALLHLGDIHRLKGNYRAALECYEESLFIFRESNDDATISWSFLVLGYLAQREQNYQQARIFFKDSLLLVQKETKLIAERIAAFAGLASAEGYFEEALRIGGLVDELYETNGWILWPSYKPEYDRDMAYAQSQLDPAIFEKYYNEGRQMTLDEGVTFVLEHLDETLKNAGSV